MTLLNAHKNNLTLRIKHWVVTLSLFIVCFFNTTASANEICSGEDFVQQMGSLGFSSMDISSTVYSQEKLESISKELAISWGRPAIEIKIEYAKIRMYKLSNEREILKNLAETEKKKPPKIYQENDYLRAMANSINAIIYEYETPEDAKQALKLLGRSSEYYASTGKYYIFSKRKRFKVTELKKYLSFCTKPLHQIFKHTVTPGNAIALPNGWDKYNKYQPEISDIDTKKTWLKQKQESPLIQSLLQFNPDKAKDLLQKGTELNGKARRTNRTALHLVLLLENSETINTLVPLLIESGIDCNTQDNYGITPLMLAAQHNLKLTQDLIACGADPLLITKSKETAYNYAKDANLKEVADYLLEIQTNYEN